VHSILRRTFVLSSLALLTLALHAQWQPPPQPQPVQISGRVVRADNGTPIQGATIALRPGRYHGTFHSKTTKTDSNGEYQFRGVQDDTYEIVASAEGFVTLAYRRDSSANNIFQRVTATTALRGINFDLVPEKTVTTGSKPIEPNNPNNPADSTDDRPAPWSPQLTG